MKKSLLLIGIAIVSGGTVQAQQQVDMEALMLWSEAKTVRFHIVGVYEKRTVIAFNSGNYAQGDVTDSLTLDFDWDISNNLIIGEPRIQDSTSKVGTLASVEAICKPPIPKGDYEHFTATKVRSTNDALIEVDGTRHYPNVDVAGCEADLSYRTVAATDEPVTELVAVPSPMMLVVPGTSGNVSVSPDKGSFTVKTDGWTWTYTPTPLK